MKLCLFVTPFILLFSCNEQEGNELPESKNETNIEEKDTVILAYYKNNKEDGKASKSSGTVSNGYMTNGKLLPFYGNNFSYFDKGSYLGGRGYVNDKVLKTIL